MNVIGHVFIDIVVNPLLLKLKNVYDNSNTQYHSSITAFDYTDLSLINARLLFWSPETKYILCSTLNLPLIILLTTLEDSIMLGMMDIHNSMILFTLIISSRSFAFDFLKRSRTNGDSIVYLKNHDILLN